jgi:hypothetical protein
MAKNFDKRIEDIYVNCKDPDYVPPELEKEFKRYPGEYKLLLGTRATFIKQKLLYEKKISNCHLKKLCGLCVYFGFFCTACPAVGYCRKLRLITPYDRMMIAYAIYMKEHKKFEKG